MSSCKVVSFVFSCAFCVWFSFAKAAAYKYKLVLLQGYLIATRLVCADGTPAEMCSFSIVVTRSIS